LLIEVHVQPIVIQVSEEMNDSKSSSANEMKDSFKAKEFNRKKKDLIASMNVKESEALIKAKEFKASIKGTKSIKVRSK
jgi:hypothetical protein